MIVLILLFLLSVKTANAFELSYWVRVDLNSELNNRGYWYRPTDQPENGIPSQAEVDKALTVLVRDYRANKIYLVYHRQFEQEKMREVFSEWKLAVEKLPVNNRPQIVPGLILREYGHDDETNWNFSDVEVVEVAGWLKANVNSRELAIFDNGRFIVTGKQIGRAHV